MRTITLHCKTIQFMQMRSAVLILVICLVVNSISAQQKNKLVIADAIDKKDYFYIPKSAMADRIQGVLYPDLSGRKVNAKKRPINFYWISSCTDGYYNLDITPEQIFFSSSHDNPNPNSLYWVIDIDSSQFQQIRKGLQNKPPQGFVNTSKYYEGSLTVFFDSTFKDTISIPDEWTDADSDRFDKSCKSQTAYQLNRYFAIINSYIADPTRKIPVPVASMTQKYFGHSRREMGSWIPVKFTPPKVAKDE